MVSKRNSKQKRQAGVTPEKFDAWMKHKTGKTQAVIAKKQGVTQKTISNWVNEIDAFLITCPSVQDLPKQIADMIPAAVKTLQVRLAKYDLHAARDVFKMAGVLYDRSKHDHLHNVVNKSIDDIQRELKKLGEIGLEPVEVKTGG